jgi:Trypsin-co-occurring domain 2
MQVIDGGVPVDELIAEVKDAVRRAGVSRVSGPGDLQIGSVQLTLRVVAARSGGVGISLRVPVIGAELRIGTKVTKQDTHVIDVALVPPKQPSHQVRGDVGNALVAAIETIRQTMASAAGGDDPWVLSESSVTLSFAVTQKGTFSLGAEGELSNEITNDLRLRLRPAGQ